MSGYIGNIPVPAATQTRDTFTATAGQTSFATSGYTPSFLDVFLNGVHLVNGTDYTASNGSDVVLTSGAADGDNLEVVSYSTFEVFGQTFTGNSTFTGNLIVDTDTLFVDATSNNVGIGTTTVDSLLHLQKFDATAYSATSADGQVGVGPTIYLKNPANSNATVGGQIVFGMRSTEAQARIGATGGDSPALTFGTADAERMRIDASGNLLVGQSSPDFASEGSVLYSPADTFGPRLNITNTSAEGLNINRLGSDGNVIGFFKTGVTVGSISVTGSSTSYNTSSDYRLKENVVPLAGAADRLAQIPVHRFNFIADPDTIVDGFLAHEVQDVVPEAVTGEKDQVETVEVTDEDGNVIGTEERPVHQGIDQSKLVPLLTAALQEALARIETLEADVAALKGEPA